MERVITLDNGPITDRQRTDNGPITARSHFAKIVAVLCVLLMLGVGNAWGATVDKKAEWAFTSGSYPSNNTNFAATSGAYSFGSNFKITNTSTGWKDGSRFKFTTSSSAANFLVSVKLGDAIPSGTNVTLKMSLWYNKASNAPLKGADIKVSTNGSTYTTTGVGTTSWTLSTSENEYSCVYTTQANLAANTIIYFQLTGKNRAGAGEGYCSGASITVPVESASGYTVTYNANGGSGTIANGTGASITLSDGTGFTAPSGYSFMGWNTANDASGTHYAAGTTGITANLDLYAEWQQTVTLNTGSQGSGANKTPTVYLNGASLADFSAHSADGYTLQGYYTASSGGTKVLNANGSFAATNVTDYITSSKWTKTGATTLYAQWAAAGSTSCDVLNRTLTGVTGTSYTAWSGKSGSASDAVYAGNSAGGNTSIQLRSSDNAGIITTTSGGLAKSVTVTWNSNTQNGRTLNVYGKNTAYSATSDLYNGSTQGTLLGTIVYGTSTELPITGDYAYIGLKSNSGAMYLTSVEICWEEDNCTPPNPLLSITSANSAFIGTPLTLTTSGGNGNSVTWSVTNGTGSATLSNGNILNPVSAGTVTVTATQAKNGDVCGKIVSQTVTISSAPINVTLYYKGTSATQSGVASPYDLTALTSPYTDNACSEWTFDGWYGSTYAKSTTKPTYITSVASTGSAYAVYKYIEGGGGGGSEEAAFNFASIAAANSWVSGTAYTTVTSSPITITASGGGNNGKFYTSDNTWRMYNGGTVSITAASGYSITAVSSTPSKTFTISDGSASLSCTDKIEFTSISVTYVSGGGTVYYATTSECGPKITAANGKWVTSADGKKVKIEIPVEASNFTSSTNLGYNISGTGFSVLDWGANGGTVSSDLSTSVIVQYLPTAANTYNDATLTISGTGATDAVVTIHGRSLPNKFVIAAQVNNTKKWKAVPANMNGANEYAGISVETDNNANPTVVTENYTTAFYGLAEVAVYADHGTGVRFSATTGSKMLWGATSGNNIDDANATDERNQEWILNTTDGINYTLTNSASSSTLKFFNNSTFGMFATGNEKLRFLAAGCDTPPSAGAVDNITKNSAVIKDWTPSGTVTIKLYSNASCTRDEVEYENQTSPATISGLFSGFTYYYKIFSGDYCVSPVGSFTTLEGDNPISVTEWQENAVVISFEGDNDGLTLSTYKEEEEHEETEHVAEDIFFSKYYEAPSNVKLLAIYNGTGATVHLDNYGLALTTSDGTGAAFSTKKFSEMVYYSEKIADDAHKTNFTAAEMSLEPGTEIILISYQKNNDEDANITSCAAGDSESGYENYYRLATPTLNFNGNDAVALVNPDGDFIDLIGAGTKAGGKSESSDVVSASGNEGTVNGFMDNPGGWYTTHGYKSNSDNTEDPDYKLSTNRCLLIRRNHVLSGHDAVARNTIKFLTLGDYTYNDVEYEGEWKGVQIPGKSTGVGADNACEGFKEVGKYDYNEWFEQFITLVQDATFSSFETDPFDGTYTIPVPGLSEMSCSNVRIDLAQNGNVIIRKDIQVPIMVAANNQMTTDELFRSHDKTPEICSTCDVVILNGAVLTKAADNAANDVPAVRDVKIYQGGKLVVPSGTHYSVNSLALRRNNEDVVSKVDIKAKDALSVTKEKGVSLDLLIDPSEWHYFTLPYNCAKADITFVDGTAAVQGTDYLLRWYNGEYRAANRTGGWQDYTGATLYAGHGYIIGLLGTGTIKKELRFPMANGVINAEKDDKDIENLHAWGGNLTDEQLTPNHKGWNLIGNPFMMDYGNWAAGVEAAVLPTGMLVEDGATWRRNDSGVRYIVEAVNNGRSAYNQVAIGSHNMEPFTAYFIQVGGAPADNQKVTFQASKRQTSAVRRRAPETDPETDNLRPIWYGLELIAPNAEKDNTTLLISDDFTDEYDMMDDLVKMRGSAYNNKAVTTAPILASRNNQGEMAFNALPDSSASVIGVPLNYFAASAGTYTFATDSRYSLTNIKEAQLYDVTTGKYYDLLEDNHSFSLDEGDNSNRFRLFVTVDRSKAPEVATGNDNVLGEGQLGLVTIDRTLVLSGLTSDADVYVYDISGKLLTGERANSSGVWRTTVPATGVYFVRVNSINGQQTLRTIVK